MVRQGKTIESYEDVSRAVHGEVGCYLATVFILFGQVGTAVATATSCTRRREACAGRTARAELAQSGHWLPLSSLARASLKPRRGLRHQFDAVGPVVAASALGLVSQLASDAGVRTAVRGLCEWTFTPERPSRALPSAGQPRSCSRALLAGTARWSA